MLAMHEIHAVGATVLPSNGPELSGFGPLGVV